MNVLMLFSGASIGIEAYTRKLLSNPVVEFTTHYAGAKNIVDQLPWQHIPDLYIKHVHSDTDVVHIQYDTHLFTGDGHHSEGLDNLVKFIDMVVELNKRVVITLHGYKYRETKGGFVYRLSRYFWCKHVVPALNKCIVIVHNHAHENVLKSQGVNTCVVQLPVLPEIYPLPDTLKNKVPIKIIGNPGRHTPREDVWSVCDVYMSLIEDERYDLYLNSDVDLDEIPTQLDGRVKFTSFDAKCEETYLEQLASFDVAIISYQDQAPLSGVLWDCISCGLIVYTHNPEYEYICDITPRWKIRREMERLVNSNCKLNQYKENQQTLHLKYSQDRVNSDYVDIYKHTSSGGDWGATISKKKLQDQPDGKINLNNQPIFTSHRSGWTDVIYNMKELHNSKGVRFDGFLERNFFSNDPEVYKTPWIGVLHNPHNMPEWFSYSTAPQQLLTNKAFQKSLKKCKGLYAMSEYHADWMRQVFDVPVESLYHPVVDRGEPFDIKAYTLNHNKLLINVGWWLRKLTSIDRVDLPSDQKLRLIPYRQGSRAVKTIDMYRAHEESLEPITSTDLIAPTAYCIPNDEYDELFTQNVIFVDYWDSSANNTVTECIARGTPLIVNKHPAVVEYLGEDYPLYFENLDQVPQMFKSISLISQAHKHLNKREHIINIDNFIMTITSGDIYKSL